MMSVVTGEMGGRQDSDGLMLDFSALRSGRESPAQLTERLTVDDLRAATNAMIDRQLALIADCYDADVTFTPEDAAADDRYAADDADVKLAWTLGHVIVHVTASAEESAFLAAEMARGVRREGRSRYETPWPMVVTIAQCRARLAESRRMRLASLDVWPDEPHLEVTFTSQRRGTMDAKGRFVMGLLHDDDHLAQIEAIIGQARRAGQEKSNSE